MSKEITWSLDTIYNRVVEVLKKALSAPLLYKVKMKKLYLEDNNIVIEGDYSYFGEEGEYKVILRNDNLYLVRYEIS